MIEIVQKTCMQTIRKEAFPSVLVGVWGFPKE